MGAVNSSGGQGIIWMVHPVFPPEILASMVVGMALGVVFFFLFFDNRNKTNTTKGHEYTLEF